MNTGSVAFFRRSLTVRTTLCPFSLKEIVCDDAPEKEQDGEKEGEEEDMDEMDEMEVKLAAWLQCSGLHTVGRWVLNYRKHPSCWAALLMLHGVPEVAAHALPL